MLPYRISNEISINTTNNLGVYQDLTLFPENLKNFINYSNYLRENRYNKKLTMLGNFFTSRSTARAWC